MTKIETVGICKVFVDLSKRGNFLVLIGESIYPHDRFHTFEEAMLFANDVTKRPFKFEREDFVEFEGQDIGVTSIVRFETLLEARAMRETLTGNGWYCTSIFDGVQAY